ncbi:hypothetical protein BB560_000100 [Smittium megazygosporum]|uniref:SPX domain-containing protein n=1 Tax=Smittium megazygosporum TaxID=133381 RepID=A0A2T9ZL93_9FUNG|nr:hypothetical protein BB560_000100 [Smittium megazygosporum]
MKFSKYIKSKETEFPEQWRDYMFPYKAFKKDIKVIAQELTDKVNSVDDEDIPKCSELVVHSQPFYTLEIDLSSYTESDSEDSKSVFNVSVEKDNQGNITQTFINYKDRSIEIESEKMFLQDIAQVLDDINQFEKRIIQDFNTTLGSLKENLVDVTRFVKIVPMQQDYECPVCLGNNIMSRQSGNVNCPICRHEKAILGAQKSDVDKSMKNMIKLYFPKESRKRKTEIHRFENEQMAKSLGLHRQNNCIQM